MPTVQSHGVDIYYETRGSGPPLAFAHGAGGNHLSWWQQVPHFAATHEVITFDHRGFGNSPCAGEDFLPEHFADDLVAIFDAESVERAAIVCQSMGGWTGLRLALHHPERVACLILGGTPAGVVTPGVRDSLARAAKRIGKEGVAANAALAPDFPDRDPARAFLYDQISGLNAPLPSDAMVRLPAAGVTEEQLADFAVPTLMLAGTEDQLFAPEALREVQALIPGADLTEFPGVGHSLYFEDPQTFNRIVGDFVGKYSA